jgi:hypothetical protein
VIFLGDFSFWKNIFKLLCYHDNNFKYFMFWKYNGFVSKARGFCMHVFSSWKINYTLKCIVTHAARWITLMKAGRIISYYANNGHTHRYIFTDRHYSYLVTCYYIHVTSGKFICADNNPHWVAIGISLSNKAWLLRRAYTQHSVLHIGLVCDEYATSIN